MRPEHVGEFACGIIHELGHIFGSELPPDDEKAREEVVFLGWEMSVAEKVGLPHELWLEGNREYIVDPSNHLGIGDFLDAREGSTPRSGYRPRYKDAVRFEDLAGILEGLRARSIELGLVQDGSPVAIR